MATQPKPQVWRKKGSITAPSSSNSSSVSSSSSSSVSSSTSSKEKKKKSRTRIDWPKTLKFSKLVYGTMRMTSWGADMKLEKAEAFFADCLKNGITTFDTADIYGHYTVEALLGAVLEKNPTFRSQIQIVTKAGVRLLCKARPDNHVKCYDSSKDYILQSVENSLQALKTTYIDLFLIHRPDVLTHPDEIAEAFVELKKKGSVLHFGVSNYTPSQFNALASRLGREGIPLVTNQIEVSILKLDALYDGTLDQCIQRGIIPMAWSPFGGGSLFKEDTKDERVVRVRKALTVMAGKHKTTIDAIALAWLLKHPAGIYPVLGTTDISRVESAVASLSVKLSHEDWYSLLAASQGHEVA